MNDLFPLRGIDLLTWLYSDCILLQILKICNNVLRLILV